MAAQNIHETIPTETLGILACVSDAVIIFDDNKVLYSNTRGHMLLHQENESLFTQLQERIKGHHYQQLEIHDTEQRQRLFIHCLPIRWEGHDATVAVARPLEGAAIDAPQGPRDHFDNLLKSAGDGYWDWYIPTGQVYFSHGWLQMLGYSNDDIDPSFNTWINLIHPDDLGQFLIIWTEYMEKGGSSFSIEYRIQTASQEYLWVEAHAIKEINSEGEVIRLTGFHRDINTRKEDEIRLIKYQEDLENLVRRRTEELEMANQKLIKLAHQDPLTQLYNRRSFGETLKKQLLVARRGNSPLCVLMIDIDYFKALNDSYGHQIGDEILVSVSQALTRSTLRPGDYVSRYGGEEFVIILQDTGMDGAIRVAQRIQQYIAELEQLPINPHHNQPVSLSIGISINQQCVQEDDIVKLADKALYAAKNNGRNQICYFSHDLESVSYVMNNSVL